MEKLALNNIVKDTKGAIKKAQKELKDSMKSRPQPTLNSVDIGALIKQRGSREPALNVLLLSVVDERIDNLSGKNHSVASLIVATDDSSDGMPITLTYFDELPAVDEAFDMRQQYSRVQDDNGNWIDDKTKPLSGQYVIV